MRDGLRARASAIAGRRGRSGSESVERGRPSSRAIVATPPRRVAVCHPEVPVGAPIPDVRVKDATIPVEGGAMPGLLALPERRPAPGILIINDVFGRSPFYDQLARRLGQAGFVAVTPEYFFREGSLPEPTREAARFQALEPRHVRGGGLAPRASRGEWRRRDDRFLHGWDAGPSARGPP